MDCWRISGCKYNSDNSLKYMKCLQKGYSVRKCERDAEREVGKSLAKAYLALEERDTKEEVDEI